MAIQSIDFGKNLRPSTVEAIKKINELVTAVNAIGVESIGQIQTDVTNLKATVQSQTNDISKLKTETASLKNTTGAHTTDIDKIKVTLYTPLTSSDDTE